MHYDQYVFQAEAGRSYRITVKSDTFAAWVDLYFGEETLQGAYVGQPGAQVQFSGFLSTARTILDFCLKLGSCRAQVLIP